MFNKQPSNGPQSPPTQGPLDANVGKGPGGRVEREVSERWA